MLKRVLCSIGVVLSCWGCGPEPTWVSDGSGVDVDRPGEDTAETDDDPRDPSEGVSESPEPDPCVALFEAYAGCATEEAWMANAVSKLPYNQTVGFGPCHGCHQAGIGVMLNEDPLVTFELFPLERLVSCERTSDGAELVPSGYLEKAGVTNPGHPIYALVPPVREAVDAFVGQAVACANGSAE